LSVPVIWDVITLSQHNIPEDLNPQLHLCGHLKSCIWSHFLEQLNQQQKFCVFQSEQYASTYYKIFDKDSMNCAG